MLILATARPGLRRFGRRNGGDFRAGHGEEHGGDGGQHGDPAMRREAAIIDEIAEGGAMRRGPAEGVRGRDGDEHQDGGDLDGGKPELELGIGARRHEIDAGHDGHQADADLQRREAGNPGCRILAPAMASTGTTKHPEVPVQPADDEPGSLAQAGARKFGEGADMGQGGGHFSQHPHHQEDEQPGRSRS